MDASQGDDFWAFTWIFPLGGERYGIKTRAYISEVKFAKLTPPSVINMTNLFKKET